MAKDDKLLDELAPLVARIDVLVEEPLDNEKILGLTNVRKTLAAQHAEAERSHSRVARRAIEEQQRRVREALGFVTESA